MKSLRLFLVALFLAIPVFATDISITAANVLPSASAQRVRVKAAATITAGQVVYQLSDGTVGLADANGVSPLYTVFGIAENGAATGQYISIITSDPQLAIGGTVASGAVVVLSATAGGIAPVADLASGWFTTILGVGIGSNKINFNPVAGTAVP